MRKSVDLEIWMKHSFFFFKFNLTLGNYFKMIILIIILLLYYIIL